MIEEVDRKKLEKLVRDEEYLAVFFCKYANTLFLLHKKGHLFTYLFHLYDMAANAYCLYKKQNQVSHTSKYPYLERKKCFLYIIALS